MFSLLFWRRKSALFPPFFSFVSSLLWKRNDWGIYSPHSSNYTLAPILSFSLQFESHSLCLYIFLFNFLIITFIYHVYNNILIYSLFFYSGFYTQQGHLELNFLECTIYFLAWEQFLHFGVNPKKLVLTIC